MLRSTRFSHIPGVQSQSIRRICKQVLDTAVCVAENGGSAETRPGIAESFAPQMSGITGDMQADIQSVQKENRPPLSEGLLLPAPLSVPP